MKQLFMLFIFSMLLNTSCKDAKAEKSNETNTETEQLAVTTYQCPMNCESGKTYDKPGICPVCKMDLKETGGKKAMTCSAHKDGKCSCEGEKCTCDNCPEHSKKMTCEMHKDGNCTCKAEMHSEHKASENGDKITCSMHKDGNCTCEGEKCKCENCPKHT